MKHLKARISENKGLIEVIFDVKNKKDYEILEEREVSYYCDCNKEKYYKGLITLGKEEILNLLEELNGTIETECHFCGKKYQFTKEDFKEFLESK